MDKEEYLKQAQLIALECQENIIRLSSFLNENFRVLLFEFEKIRDKIFEKDLFSEFDENFILLINTFQCDDRASQSFSFLEKKLNLLSDVIQYYNFICQKENTPNQAHSKLQEVKKPSFETMNIHNPLDNYENKKLNNDIDEIEFFDTD